MTEKEFLISFLEFCYNKYNPLAKEYHPDYEKRLNESTSEFLEEHHKEYYEVEFVEKEEESEFAYADNAIAELNDNGEVTWRMGVDRAQIGQDKSYHTLYDKEGKVIGWSSLTPEQLRELYSKYAG